MKYEKHIINDHLFDDIDTEEKAYFLGLLFSDGNVSSSSNAINIKLHNKDKDILEKLSNIIFCSPARLYKSENNTILKFSSKPIKDRLVELGCIPNKSLKIVYPNINENLNNHFIRGYFDGDGSLYSHDHDYVIALISTEDFCKSINDIINNNFNINGILVKDKKMLSNGNNITTYLKYTGTRKAAKIMDWLYKDANIYLERKHNKYLELKQWIAEVDSRTNRYSKI
jgi:intein/homing endonuclease